jgi:hypothetical protein
MRNKLHRIVFQIYHGGKLKIEERQTIQWPRERQTIQWPRERQTIQWPRERENNAK